MKKNILTKSLTSLIIIFSILTHSNIDAQEKNEAVLYMQKLSKESDKIVNKMWDYVRTSAHTQDIKKINKLRKSLIKTIKTSIKKVNKIKPFKGDSTYKKAKLNYLNLLYIITKQDYAKIVDMKKIAEQSYDHMEAYILAQKEANQKLNNALENFQESEKKFASQNNINLLQNNSKIVKNLIKSSEVMKYYNKLYLIFFKSYKQELYLFTALKKNNINMIEQNRKTLLKYSTSGLDELDDIDDYDGDASVKNACENSLKFYKNEAEKVSIMIDYFVKKDSFEKVKKAFSYKKKSEITKEEVELYNKKAKELNQASQDYNKLNKKFNKERSRLIANWNKTKDKYYKKHIPKK